jgi:hypothetical protein
MKNLDHLGVHVESTFMDNSRVEKVKAGVFRQSILYTRFEK